ncbi:MAG: hypothetical protein EKK29_15390 [Hyphomicrobiales bacterium]|nr:MAG: hypothetical protein EKK29_15390 [Hyphomicrobiales bacterium]
MDAYHMSAVAHPVGRALHGNGQPKVPQEIEEALERYRPPDCFDRLNSVYAVETPDFSKLGLDAGYIFKVDIGDEFQRHDAYWIGQLQLAYLKSKYRDRPYVSATWPDWTEDFVADCCAKYWRGETSNQPLWELLSKEAEVKEQLSTTIIDAASTSGGWRVPA